MQPVGDHQASFHSPCETEGGGLPQTSPPLGLKVPLQVEGGTAGGGRYECSKPGDF
jgi:hypothetical protein